MIDRNEIFSTIRDELTEERTDQMIDITLDYLYPKLPVWFRWSRGFVRSGLDKAMPEAAHHLLYLLVFGERADKQIVPTPPYPEV